MALWARLQKPYGKEKKNNTNLQDQICIQLLLLRKSHSNLPPCGKLLISRVDEKMKYKFLWTQQCRHLIKTGSLSTWDFSSSKNRKEKRNQPCWAPGNTEADRISITQIPVRRLLGNTFIIIPWETVGPWTLWIKVLEGLLWNSGHKWAFNTNSNCKKIAMLRKEVMGGEETFRKQEDKPG